jgi:hypothetical protein
MVERSSGGERGGDKRPETYIRMSPEQQARRQNAKEDAAMRGRLVEAASGKAQLEDWKAVDTTFADKRVGEIRAKLEAGKGMKARPEADTEYLVLDKKGNLVVEGGEGEPVVDAAPLPPELKGVRTAAVKGVPSRPGLPPELGGVKTAVLTEGRSGWDRTYSSTEKKPAKGLVENVKGWFNKMFGNSEKK